MHTKKIIKYYFCTQDYYNLWPKSESQRPISKISAICVTRPIVRIVLIVVYNQKLQNMKKLKKYLKPEFGYVEVRCGGVPFAGTQPSGRVDNTDLDEKTDPKDDADDAGAAVFRKGIWDEY